jgi:Ca2+-transporting ATPase
MSNAYQLEKEAVLQSLETNETGGLSSEEAARRFHIYGANELVEVGRRSPWRIFWEQFTAKMVLVLIGAALLSAVLGEYKDAIVIGAIVAIFGILGFVQEYRAEQAMSALKKLSTPTVRIIRDHKICERSAQDLVPGDILILEAGNIIPADSRLIETNNLKIQEAALTGESEPVEKASSSLPPVDIPLGDRRNMAYMGTLVTYGRGRAVVVATGMRTELGKVATMLQDVKNEQTPLQKRLDQVGKLLAVAGILIAGIYFILGLLRGESTRHMLLTSVSIAVAIIPEGLPAVVTITLAIGAQRILKRRALVRKLPAVETLGSVTTICSDKTGTLTENRMTVMVVDVAGHQLNLIENLRLREPVLVLNEQDLGLLASQPDSVGLLLVGGALCNDAILQIEQYSRTVRALGDPTEAALVVAAAKTGLMKDRLEEVFPRIAEVPFDSERKRMSTIHRVKLTSSQDVPGFNFSSENPFIGFTKGSVDGLLEISSQVWAEGKAENLTETWRKRIQDANEQLARQGMRVLGITFRTFKDLPSPNRVEEIERELIFVGLVGMIDPPRPEVKEAVRVCQMAGIRPIMITGDHPLTARQIALELGITGYSQADQPEKVLTGLELNQISDPELEKIVQTVSIYARVSPEHKLRIVRALQSQGQIVAMTGDGVNDAPALKRADIGVAMGITGTDVSKEASDMVLQDDNFATIVAAVEEGRTIYDNLRKFVKFSVAGNIGKVLVMLLAPFLGKPLPLYPLQLLWLNLLTDGLLGLGLGLEPPEQNIMRRPPYSPRQGIFSGGLGWHVLWVGGLIGGLSLGLGYVFWRSDPNGSWQTITFTTLAFAQLFQALATRSTHESLFSIGISSNKAGMGLAFVTFLLQMAVVYAPFLQDLFRTQPLTLQELGICLLASAPVFLALEGEKTVKRFINRSR